MFNRKRLAELEEAQRLLVVQSDLHRGMIQLEVTTVRDQFQWLRSASQIFEMGRPFFLGAAALTGGIAVSKWRKFSRWIPVVFSAWRLLRPIFSPK